MSEVAEASRKRRPMGYLLAALPLLLLGCNLFNPYYGLPVSTPQLSPTSGTFASEQLITITDATAGASIYYTTDASMPSTSSTLYSSPIDLSANGTFTIMAIATNSGQSMKQSSVASGTYIVKLGPQAPAPQFSIAPGSYPVGQLVSLTDSASGASIYFTTDGSTPTPASPSTYYSGSITLIAKGTVETIKAIAVTAGLSNSPVASASYSITGSSFSITTFAGTATPGYTGDNITAITAELQSPSAVALDSSGNLYIADTNNQRVRKVSAGIIATVAGVTASGYSGDYGPATAAELSDPSGVAVDSAGNLYIADTNNQRIRRVDTSGFITTIAGTGTAGFSGDGGPGILAQLSNPAGLAIDRVGNLIIADKNNQRIRKVDTSGNITTIAGTGSSGYSGDKGPASSAELSSPSGVAADPEGDIYVADSGNNRIRKIGPSGVITTIAGSGAFGFSGDGGAATAAFLSNPAGVGLDTLGNIFIADTGNHVVRLVNGSGVITTAAGSGNHSGYSGDAGAATAALLANPAGIVSDGLENIYVADTGGQVRKLF